jgi:hypothetical protein
MSLGALLGPRGYRCRGRVGARPWVGALRRRVGARSFSNGGGRLGVETGLVGINKPSFKFYGFKICYAVFSIWVPCGLGLALARLAQPLDNYGHGKGEVENERSKPGVMEMGHRGYGVPMRVDYTGRLDPSVAPQAPSHSYSNFGTRAGVHFVISFKLRSRM